MAGAPLLPGPRIAALVAVLAAPVIPAIGCSFDLEEVRPPPAAGSGGAGGEPTSSSADTSTAGPVTTGAGGSGGAQGAGGSGGTGGSGGSGPPPATGCSDGTREAYQDESVFQNIAACAGGFTVAGVTSTASKTPACARQGGNTGAKPDGLGCSVEDLCAAGWHVCTSDSDVQNHAPAQAPGCPADINPEDFFLTRQAQDADSCAGPPSDNNLAGCGGPDCLFVPPDPGDGCEPLTRMIKNGECVANNPQPWNCNNSGDHEARDVTKPGPQRGGALCCKDL